MCGKSHQLFSSRDVISAAIHNGKSCTVTAPLHPETGKQHLPHQQYLQTFAHTVFHTTQAVCACVWTEEVLK
jgi:hypothetical protein